MYDYNTDISVQVLSAIPDQDTFYDMTDVMEEQDLEKTMQSRMKRKGTKPELLEQFRIYDMMIREEDAQENMQLDLIENIRFQNYYSTNLCEMY